MAKKKDEKYKIVQNLLVQKNLTGFSQIFLYISKKTVCTDMGLNYARFIDLVKNPQKFRLQELFTIASLFEVEPKIIVDLAYDQIIQGKKKAK